MDQPRKILILYLTGLGSTILFIPTLRVLRHQLADTVVDIMVRHEASKEILERINCSRRIYVFNPKSHNKLFEKLKFLHTLRQERYDVSITTFPSNRSAFNILSFLIGAKRRIFPRYQVGYIETLGFLQNEAVDMNGTYHDVKQNLSLLTPLGLDVNRAEEDIGWDVTEDEARQADHLLKEAHLTPDDLLIGFHPGCNPAQGNMYKRWPAKSFAMLGDILVEEFGANILVFGSNNETPLKKDIFSVMKHKPVIPETTSLLNTAALIKTCRLFITNDSGLMHTAVAMGIPTISVFGPSNPARNAPYGSGHIVIRADLPCMPCNKYPYYQYGETSIRCIYNNAYKGFCMHCVSVEKVHQAIVQNYADLLEIGGQRRKSSLVKTISYHSS